MAIAHFEPMQREMLSLLYSSSRNHERFPRSSRNASMTALRGTVRPPLSSLTSACHQSGIPGRLRAR